MAFEVKLPRLGQGMESGTVVRWLKAEGDPVEKGEPLYEVDTEKVTQEVEADASGVLLRIAVQEGEVPVGAVVAFIGEAGEEVPDTGAPSASPAPEPAPAAPGMPAEGEGPPVAAVSAPADRAGDGRVPGERIKASPLARRLARERGVDLAAITGTGPEGRIVAEDVEHAAVGPAAPAPLPPAAPPSAEPELVPLTSIRRTIARRLTEAWQIPVFQLVISADMTAANRVIERRRELEPDVRVTVTDLLVKTCATALTRHPEVNVQFTEEGLLRFPSVSVGIAAATDRGLVVPVVHGADRLSLSEIALARADVVGRARDGALRQEDLDGGTFTISNLGMYGLDQFVAVLNAPQAAILAVGAAQERVVVRPDGSFVPRPTVTLTLTCDHRAVDGAPAAEFLETLKAMLEDPGLAL